MIDNNEFWKLFGVFIASLIGSVHCSAMCGGMVFYFSGRSNNKLSAHIAYHIGRLVTYAILGFIFGSLALSMDKAGELVGVQRITLGVTGVLLIVWGISGLLNIRFFHTAGKGCSTSFTQNISTLFGHALKSENPNWTYRAFTIGLLSAFLPCGWLYSFVTIAASMGAPIKGVLVMLLFWAGTVPTLILVGGLSEILSVRLKQTLPRVTACLLIAIGLFSLSGRFEILFFNQQTKQPTSCPFHAKVK